MRHTVIPAPARLEAGGREFVFRPGTAVGYTDTGLAPLVGRFCSQIARRTGLRLAAKTGRLASDEPSVTIELAAGDDFRALPAPTGLSPAGGGPGGGAPADERHSLAIGGDQVVVRAVEPVGVARALTTLIQLLAATPPGRAGEIRLPGTRILDAPRFAWRGLSLDVARRFFTVGEIRRVIDLLALMGQVLAEVTEIFPGPYVHIGGDEPRGMPHELYASYVERLRRLVRVLGRRPLGWQESARAGLGPDDIIQYWFAGVALAASVPPQVRAQLDADLALSRRDLETAATASVPVIVSPLSHCYLDVPYADVPADPAQADRQGRLGLRLYAPATVAESYEWEPADVLGPGREAQVAGVEAAIWAETIAGFDDLCFLLLPRLPGVADKAWSAPQLASWAGHRDRVARHGRLWAQDDLTYFRTSTVDWL